MSRLALVTGASSGIGAAYAEVLAADGWDLLVVARRKDRLDQLSARLGSEHRIAVTVAEADLSRPDQLERLADRVSELPVEMLVNNAGLGEYMPFTDLPVPTLLDLVNLDVLAPVRLARAVLPGMQSRRSGAVINISSLLAFSGTWTGPFMPARAVYAAAKSFLVTFSQVLSSEVRDQGIRVQVCCPGIVRTEFHTRQGMDLSSAPRMEPEAIVHASLRDLHEGVVLSVPGLDDPSMLANLDASLGAVMGATRAAELPARYRD
ncbi:MAG: SDR family NAD(P)-dependent oxidoreductase [Candidatus Dormibacteraeota bacterium]|uniref:SDR family NAD(P)-dependent oxidoreductase n=1 Tax=Candidatus Aeolococcus gillhamiae TaxID=3127015 RepID=A0A2W6ALD2_9BACT|nr:SDR family NAD(P)-dependent oxidoreductase [Candidatus Dormibacteraeota bacterium]PZR78551.1 MAG: short-chain dehydrogenase [Candidatus Dormibacter sp. RRmetagenome_bin12]